MITIFKNLEQRIINKVTAQIPIKLNKKQFGEMLEMLHTFSKGIKDSKSALVGLNMFYLFYMSHVKEEKLDNLTRAEFLMKALGNENKKNTALLEINQEYNLFLKLGARDYLGLKNNKKN